MNAKARRLLTLQQIGEAKQAYAQAHTLRSTSLTDVDYDVLCDCIVKAVFEESVKTVRDYARLVRVHRIFRDAGEAWLRGDAGKKPHIELSAYPSERSIAWFWARKGTVPHSGTTSIVVATSWFGAAA